MRADLAAEYNAWLLQMETGHSPSLEEYAKWLAYDSNLPYRLGTDHLENLLDEALERLELLERWEL